MTANVSGYYPLAARLASDFAPHGACPRAAVPALYQALGAAGELFGGVDAGSDAIAAQNEVPVYSALLVKTCRHHHAVVWKRLAHSVGISAEIVDPTRLLFAIQTYYSLCLKLIAVRILQQLMLQWPSSSPICGSSNDRELRYWLTELESGNIYCNCGLEDFTGSGEYNWYLTVWNCHIADAIREIMSHIEKYDFHSIPTESQYNVDVFKTLYLRLIPANVRHVFGEYYTPNWLAELVLDEVAYEGDARQRLVDPACGSGTFLVLAGERLKQNCRRFKASAEEMLAIVLHNIVGMDINRLAVLSAKTNYLIMLGELLRYSTGPLRLPVYCADSVLIALAGGTDQGRNNDRTNRVVPWGNPSGGGNETVVTWAPQFDGQVTRQQSPRDGSITDTCGGRYSPGGERFDLVVGNPPWVTWESLPVAYRQLTKPLWQSYGLFPHRGMDAILGKGKKDLSMLMSYVVTDRLLKTGGRLGFVMTQSVLKMSGAAQGFRRFRVGTDAQDAVAVKRVHDLSALRPFDGAATRPCVIVWEKGSPTQYPVTYYLWQPLRGGRFKDQQANLQEVLESTKRQECGAEPIDRHSLASSWITVPRDALPIIRLLAGKSWYRAYEGVNTGGANGIYWVEVLRAMSSGLLLVRNLAQGGKRQVPQLEVQLEADVIYPLLRGHEVTRWSATTSAYIILVQDVVTRKGIDEDVLRQRFPCVYEFLKKFEEPLRARAAYRRYFMRQRRNTMIETAPFYSMFNVGSYSLSPWKVVWHRMVAPLGAVVVTQVDGKTILPQETHAFVPTDSLQEAYYVAGMLNSLPFNFAVMAYSQTGGKSFASPHILENLALPRFDERTPGHVRVAKLSETIHELVRQLPPEELACWETRLDEAAAQVWGVDRSALEAMRCVLGLWARDGYCARKSWPAAQRTALANNC